MYYSYNSNIIKGDRGESMVAGFLSQLPSENYIVINDILLKKESAGGREFSTQIDHIVISYKGIFIIETKNLKGYIYGQETDKNWTQKFRKSSYSFQNPMIQNKRHELFLKERLKGYYPKVETIPFYSVIVFTNDNCELMKVPYSTVKVRQLFGFIDRFDSGYRLHPNDMNYLAELINKMNLSGNREEFEQHVERVQEHITGKNQSISKSLTSHSNQPSSKSPAYKKSTANNNYYPRYNFEYEPIKKPYEKISIMPIIKSILIIIGIIGLIILIAYFLAYPSLSTNIT